MQLVDFHTHSAYSPDGHEAMEHLCDAAAKRGLSHLAVTDHFDAVERADKSVYLYPYDGAALYKTFSACKARYQNELTLCLGIELGQPYLLPDNAQKVLEALPYDFVLGSVHFLRGEKDLQYISYTEGDYTRQYYEELLELAACGAYDVLAHLEMPKRYALMQGAPYSPAPYMEQIEAALKLVIAAGKGIELNTSGIRKYKGGILPSQEILTLYRRLGGEIVTLGSDAHSAAEIGADIGAAADLLRQTGFSYFAVYQGRKPTFLPL